MNITVNGQIVEIKPVYALAENSKNEGRINIVLQCTTNKKLSGYELEKVEDAIRKTLMEAKR